MAGAVPEERVRPPLHRQRWSRVAFVHWRYDPGDLVGRLPHGADPDLVDGAAWVSLTPLVIERARVPGLPALPVISSFPEVNLRTYVRTADGQDALCFLSLDAGSPLPLAVRATLGLPYVWSEVSVEEELRPEGRRVAYHCRRFDGTARLDLAVNVGDELAGGERLALDDALTGRWRALVWLAGRLAVLPVRHRPWPLRRAELLDCSETLTAAAGLPAPAGQPVVHYADGVDVAFGPPRLVRAAARAGAARPATA